MSLKEFFSRLKCSDTKLNQISQLNLKFEINTYGKFSVFQNSNVILKCEFDNLEICLKYRKGLGLQIW